MPFVWASRTVTRWTHEKPLHRPQVADLNLGPSPEEQQQQQLVDDGQTMRIGKRCYIGEYSTGGAFLFRARRDGFWCFFGC